MQNIYSIVAFGVVVVMTSCSPKAEQNMVTNFTREDFTQQVVLVNPEDILLDDLSGTVNPASFTLLRDSILLIQNQPGKQFSIELYSLYSRKPLAYLAPIGRGPGEFLSCSYMGHSVDHLKIYLKDSQAHIYYIVDFSKTLEHGKIAVEQQFFYNPEIHSNSELLLLDDRYYTGYNMWYLDDSQYNNNVPALKKYEIDPENRQASQNTVDPMMGYTYFVGTANGARLLLDPNKQNIWLFDQRRDKIEIYNDALVQIKTLCGPDHYKVRYMAQQAGNAPVQLIGFEQGKEYRTYSDYAYNRKHIYAVYIGVDSFDMDQLPAVEVFKLDWHGNLLCRYKLDRFIYGISVDSGEEYLYGTTRKSFKDTLQFIRYKL